MQNNIEKKEHYLHSYVQLKGLLGIALIMALFSYISHRRISPSIRNSRWVGGKQLFKLEKEKDTNNYGLLIVF